MSQNIPVNPVKRIGTITMHLFDNGVAEVIYQNPGKQLQAALMPHVPRLIHEAGNKIEKEGRA
ncbi:hypothetical protein [Chromobacterium amazonense]|uniref:hypothetical protein n=1 Tax=Chromobacterium amazonense TaxID=1382803 RepID=UPI00237E032D|nr:hypothetical protein [Chromobacterium amazonense]MDE1714520.1 hypothetical protein [Chromobacterium amazonense]